jgi:hypothetical protein
MGNKASSVVGLRVDICTLEADLAFFEARLSLAGDTPATAYQRAQIKTYKTLGILLGSTLKKMKKKVQMSAPRQKRPPEAEVAGR